MAFTYDLTTDLGKLRLQTGDTISTEALLEDAEHQYMLDTYGGLTVAAKLNALYAIRAKWMRDVDRSSVGLSASRSQRMQHINDVIKSMEAARSGVSPSYLYGVSISERTSNSNDTDLIKPAFTRTRWDNNSSGGATSGDE